MNNLRRFKSETAGLCPNYWPSIDYEIVSSRLLCNLPLKVGLQHYHYIRRVDFPSSVCTIIVEPNGNILFYPCALDADTAKFKKWLDANLLQLKELSARGFEGVLVGKLAPDRPDILGLYYIIDNKKTVWVDGISIQRLLRLQSTPLGDCMFVVQSSAEFLVTVHKTAHMVSSPALDEVPFDQRSICLPLGIVEKRDSAIMESRMTTYPVLMEFASFIHISHHVPDDHAVLL